MRLGSLFSGIGGLELGLEASLGATTVWQVECDAYARQVLEKKWPGASRDVLDVREAGKQNLEPVDVLAAGFPCQGISVAGKGRGLKDERSGLWFEALRIIRELRPPIVVLENVPAIRTRGLGVVLGGLASLGYDAEWGMLSASDIGAPHQRRRWWCVASLANAQSVRRGVSIGGEEPSEARTTASSMEHSDSARLEEQRFVLPTQEELGAIERSGTRASESRLGRGPHGFRGWAYEGSGLMVQPWENGLARTVEARSVPHRVSRLKCLGNAVVPMWSFWIGIKVREVVDWLQ